MSKIEASYEDCEALVKIIREKTQIIPKIGIVCGSGLGGIGDIVTDPVSFSYSDLPGFHVSAVPGHKSRLLLGQIAGVNVVCMQGRFHGYEGIAYNKCAFPIRVMKLLGIEFAIVTNAAGGLDRSYKLGDFMVLKDHLPVAMWSCNGPLVGPNEGKFGPRFPAMSNAYDKELQKLVKETADEIGIGESMRNGVYAMMSGPCYESIAELRMLVTMGANVVGMSTCPEVMVAHHAGIRCIGMSMVTNVCPLDWEDDTVANHAEVIEIAKKRAVDMENLVKALLPKLDRI